MEAGTFPRSAEKLVSGEPSRGHVVGEKKVIRRPVQLLWNEENKGIGIGSGEMLLQDAVRASGAFGMSIEGMKAEGALPKEFGGCHHLDGRIAMGEVEFVGFEDGENRELHSAVLERGVVDRHGGKFLVKDFWNKYRVVFLPHFFRRGGFGTLFVTSVWAGSRGFSIGVGAICFHHGRMIFRSAVG